MIKEEIFYPTNEYNDIAKWQYTKFIKAFDGKAITLQAKTKKEFLEALNSARRTNELVYIEAFTSVMDAPDLALKLSAKCSPVAK